ncbi:MAG: DUF1501 domain-containing protein [Vicinamibacterales bacterium]
MTTNTNRRDFLKQVCAVGAAGVASHFTRLGMVTAHAQAAADYKALVCVFLFGGNDANNMVVPLDGRYAQYSAMRGSVALAANSLRPVGATGYGLHPALGGVQQICNEQRGAMVFNVGTLVRPTTKATLGSTPLPRNLYSHSDQTQQWQSSDPTGGATGWGGRVNEVLAGVNTGPLPPGITVSGGNALFLAGANTQGLNLSNVQSLGFQTFGDDVVSRARLTALQRLLTFDTGLRLVGAANGVLEGAVDAAQEINAALAGAPPLPVAFPTSGIGRQLAQVAQLLAVRGTLGMNRQIFFAGMGGFDNHEELLANHQGLMATLDAAIAAFMATLDLWGLSNQVTLFTESEFNRTADANATIGTDHAWGGTQLVLGGAVQGGTYGTFPTLQLRGPDDAGDRGYWIPTISLDQYAATLGRWFGVPDASLDAIFPNLGNFAPRTLGFLQS